MDSLFSKPIAHRGLHSEFIPENSIEAFSQAAKHNYNIELDIQLTKDNKVIVFHDHTLFRMCGVDKLVNSLTLDEIQSYYLKDSNKKIPTLKQVLAVINGSTGLLIELKSASRKDFTLERLANDELKNYKGFFAIQSFNPYSVRWFTKFAPHIMRGILATGDYGKYYNAIIRYMLTHLFMIRAYKPNFISCDKNYVNSKIIEKLNLPKFVWTINSLEEMEAAKDARNIIFENFLPNF